MKGSKIPEPMHLHSRMLEVPLIGHPKVKTVKTNAQTVINSIKNWYSNPLPNHLVGDKVVECPAILQMALLEQATQGKGSSP